MNSTPPSTFQSLHPRQTPIPRVGGTAALLPFADVLSVALAAALVPSLLTLSPTTAGGGVTPALPAALVGIAAAFAPFLLHEPQRGVRALRRARVAMPARFLGRWMLLSTLVGAIALAGNWLQPVGASTLAAWWISALLLSGLARVVLGGRSTSRARLSADAQAQAMPVAADVVADCLPVRLLSHRPIARWNAVLKRGSDLLLALLICLALLPVLALIALAIRIDSRGPIVFKQRRHGINNREFDIYKFRTMRCDTGPSGAGLQQTLREDPRITRVGRFLRKWSLDELPQLFNVLEGNMALVGPRPHAVDMRTEALLGHEICEDYAHRHRVRPGITGWSQVNGARGATDTLAQLRERIALDIYYIEHWSLLLDLRILLLTLRAVLRATNAY